MSTTTTQTTQPRTSRILPHCKLHPDDTCVELKLPAKPEGEQLNFMFVTLRNPNDHTHISVLMDLLLQCDPYRAPSGYKVVDNKTVHFFYEGDYNDYPEAFEAQGKLVARLNKHIEEVCTRYRRDPQSNLVYER